MIYNYLFYKSYQLGKWSRNFEDIPVLGGVIWVAMCLMFNLFTLEFLLQGLGTKFSLDFDEKYKFVVALLFLLLLIFYYSYKENYKKIIEKYEEKERLGGKGLHPIVVIAVYYGISVILLFLAAMYRNKYGIFS